MANQSLDLTVKTPADPVSVLRTAGQAERSVIKNKMKQDQSIYPRDLTDEERVLTRWIIENGSEDSSRFLQQLEQAKVYSKCSCGCASVDFAINGSEPSHGSKMEIIGDFIYGDKNTLCGIFVFAKADQLAGLEVYPLAVDEVPKELPSSSILRPLETELNKSTEPEP